MEKLLNIYNMLNVENKMKFLEYLLKLSYNQEMAESADAQSEEP